jgi:hypothetical protein
MKYLWIILIFVFLLSLFGVLAESPFNCKEGPKYNTTVEISPQQDCIKVYSTSFCEQLGFRIEFNKNCNKNITLVFNETNKIEFSYNGNYPPFINLPINLGSKWQRTFYFSNNPEEIYTISGEIINFVENCTGCIYAGKCSPIGAFHTGFICSSLGAFIPAKTQGDSCKINDECYKSNCVNHKCVRFENLDYENYTLNLSNGRKAKIKIMPDKASEAAINRLGELGFNITLRETGGKAVYHFEGIKEGKLFGFIKKNAKVEVEVDAEADGKILSVKKPWWSFLAKGI